MVPNAMPPKNRLLTRPIIWLKMWNYFILLTRNCLQIGEKLFQAVFIPHVLYAVFVFKNRYILLNLKNIGRVSENFIYRLPNKETTLERADFTLQLLMLVTMEKERKMFIIFFLFILCRQLSRSFKQGQAESVHTMKAQTNRPRRQLFLI